MNLRMKNTSEAKQWIQAAREWPENLGSGKPYPPEIDERIEDWLESLCDRSAETLPVLDEALKITGDSQIALVQKILAELQRDVTKEPKTESKTEVVPK